MLHFSVARHYCGGHLAATKVSLSGSLATCGMEAEYQSCRHDQDGDQIESHCCDDDLTTYFIDNNYTPASKITAGFAQLKIQVPVMPIENPVRLSFIVNRFWSDISPPGLLMTSSVDLPVIGVFRI